MVRIFSVEEVNRLRSFVETRTDNWEDFLNDDEIALLSSRNYQNALWLVISTMNISNRIFKESMFIHPYYPSKICSAKHWFGRFRIRTNHTSGIGLGHPSFIG